VLRSANRHFGGVSAIRVAADGANFIALTDKGFWWRGRIVYQDTRPVAIADSEMAPILGPDGRPLAARGWFDTESIAEDGDTLYVGIERVHQIVRFNYGKDGLLARGQPIAVPPTMRSLPSNRGIEALVLVPKSSAKESSARESSAKESSSKESSTKKNSARERLAAKEDAPVKDSALAGTLIAISERGLDKAGNINAFLIGGSSPGSFTVKRSASYDISDAALLPGGDLLLLERRFSWTGGLAIRMRRIALADIMPNALVDGAILFEADLGYEIDNMEGLSVHRGASGEVVLTLVSDDNFSIIQRTLLLQFTLVEP
jgi:hypothetical protein